jgi:hypothetical protein
MRSRPNQSVATILMAGLSLFSLIPFTFNSAAAPLEPASKPPNHVSPPGLLAPKGLPTRTQEGSPTMQMPMVFPLFLQNEDFSSALVLTNAANQSTYADVILKTTNGTEITHQRVEFTAHSQSSVNLQSLLMSAVSPATTGSIIVMQSPEFDGTMVILGQLSITNHVSTQPNYIDEEVAMPNTAGSQTLRAVADSGEGSPLVAVTNLSEAGQRVAIRCFTQTDENASKSVDLLAGETLLTEACSGRTIHGAVIESFSQAESEDPHGPVGVCLTTDGMPGSIAAFGLQPHKKGDHHFFSNVTFTDPKMLMSPATVFDGVPVGPASLLSSGNYVPELSLTNFSAKALQINVQYAQTSGTTPATRQLAAFSIPAESSLKVTFDDIQGDPQLQNSFVVNSTGAPGDLLAKLVSKNDSAPDQVELLGKDAQDTNNGGSNPWSIEGSSESTLLFFNHDQAPQIFNVLIASADGTQWDKDFKLAPMETRAISIGDIIQNAVKDDKGKTLPQTAVSGQISWWTVGAASGPGTGRLLQSNSSSSTARSFSCGCPYILCGFIFDLLESYLLEGDTLAPLDELTPTICLYKTNTHCGGVTTSNSSSQALHYSWTADGTYLQISGSSTNSSVNGYGASVGTGGMNGTVSATYFGPAETCTFTGGGNSNVGTLSCPSVTRGSSTTCTVSNAPGGSTFNTWTFKDSNSNTVNGSGITSSWSGTMVTSGTVSVNVVTNSKSATVQTNVTVTNRNWHTAPATAAEVANGTFITLPVPPQNTGTDSGLGYSKWQITDNGTNSTTISDGGPNNGYYFYTANLTFSAFYYQYEINPDLENTGSTFYQAQCGNYNATTNPNGFISGSNLLAQTNRHEWNSSTESHHAFYSNGLTSNNPGDYVESRVAPPGTDIATFDTATRNGINADYTAIGSAFSVEPYPVNYSETGVPLGNINYSPYASCN